MAAIILFPTKPTMLALALQLSVERARRQRLAIDGWRHIFRGGGSE